MNKIFGLKGKRLFEYRVEVFFFVGDGVVVVVIVSGGVLKVGGNIRMLEGVGDDLEWIKVVDWRWY